MESQKGVMVWKTFNLQKPAHLGGATDVLNKLLNYHWPFFHPDWHPELGNKAVLT